MPRERDERGMTLIELVLGISLLAMITGGIVLVFVSAASAQASGASALEAELEAQRGLQRIRTLLKYSSRDVVFPAPEAPFWTSSITFQRPAELAGEEPAWGVLERIELVYAPGEVDDGLDNDGNGLVDEGRVVWTSDVGGPDERSLVIVPHVPELLEGELANGLDDNGNGLVDEPGLCLALDGGRVLIQLTTVRFSQQRVLQRTLAGAVTFRN